MTWERKRPCLNLTVEPETRDRHDALAEMIGTSRSRVVERAVEILWERYQQPTTRSASHPASESPSPSTTPTKDP